MTVISSGMILAPAVALASNAGVLAYQNNVTFSTITATSSLPFRPITNAANPATAFVWEAASNADQTVTIDNGGAIVDYLGIARHNLNQIGLQIRVRFDGQTVIPFTSVTSAQAQLILFSEAAPNTVEIEIQGATDPVIIGVIYLGISIRMERNIYVGHTPINYGRDRTSINGRSENGQYLGELVVNESLTTQVSLQNLTPQWYREVLDPFFALKPRVPCFWAWRPESYPDEVGYCWVEGDPRPTNQRANGMMQIDWTFRGLA
jgi:hypothetical protein